MVSHECVKEMRVSVHLSFAHLRSEFMVTRLPQRNGSQSSDGRASPRRARPLRREVIHAEPRFDGIFGQNIALTAVLMQA
jgi:hypothetical protein